VEIGVLVQAGMTPAATAAPAQAAPAQASAAASAPDPVLPAGPVVQAAQPSREEVAQAARQIRELLQQPPASLEFFLDEQSGRFLIRIVDLQTRQVLREAPSDELLLALARALGRVQGAGVSAKA
jgi:flagellar protein FlaG